MKSLFFILMAFAPCSAIGQAQLKLAPPKVRQYAPFFARKTTLQLEFALDGASIRYAAAGDDKASIYRKPIQVRKTGSIRVWTEHPDFLHSDTIDLPFFTVAAIPEKVHLLTASDSLYPGNGASGLIDLKQGGRDLHDGNWLGFRGDSVIVDVTFKHSKRLKTLIISLFDNPSSWIWPCRSVSVYAGNLNLAGEWHQVSEAKEYTGFRLFTLVPVLKQRYDKIRIVLKTYGLIPENYPGAGSPAWLFLDEILFQ